jgi:hypothetical protein
VRDDVTNNAYGVTVLRSNGYSVTEQRLLCYLGLSDGVCRSQQGAGSVRDDVSSHWRDLVVIISLGWGNKIKDEASASLNAKFVRYHPFTVHVVLLS